MARRRSRASFALFALGLALATGACRPAPDEPLRVTYYYLPG